MRYWLYSEGNILGPYEPAELLVVPSFNEESLVCYETATGDNADDWKPASQLGEISSMLSVGTGRALVSGVRSASYELEAPSVSSAGYFEDKNVHGGSSYGELLDSIDEILGTRKGGKDFEGGHQPPKETDYDLAEKFDIRLSRIQEELEAARWEKNLLLEKMRVKDLEERKNRERISELEARLKGELRSAETGARETEQIRHLSDLKERADSIRKIEELKKEELSLNKFYPEDTKQPAGAEDAKLPPKSAIEPETKTLKTVSSSGQVNLEKHTDAPADPFASDAGFASRKLKSVGQTQPPAYVYGSDNIPKLSDRNAPVSAPAAGQPPAASQPAPRQDAGYRDTPLPGPEAAPPGSFKGFENMEPLRSQAGGVVYDFTAVTPRQEGTSQKFSLEPDVESAQAAPRQSQPAQAPRQEPQAAAPFAFAPISTPAPAPAPVPAYQPPQAAQPFTFGSTAPQQGAPTWGAQAPAAKPAPTLTPAAPAPVKPPAETVSFSPSDAPAGMDKFSSGEAAPEKTQRLTADMLEGGGAKAGAKAGVKTAVQAVKDKFASKMPAKGPATGVKKGGKTAFIAVIIIFGFIAAGGLGYFFLGEGLSFSEFSMINFGGKKPAATAEAGAPEGAAPQVVGEGEQPGATEQAQQPAPAPVPEQAQPAPEISANENIRKALDIVKSYKLAGGRGTIESWFANAFLSGGAGGSNEEWTATPLHGDILVVQYRLLRPKQDPMIYQFEVDAAKGDIVRGINNNAIELLDRSAVKESTASAAPAKKRPAPKPKLRKPVRPREVPILPLPEDTGTGQAAEPDPTGFEQPETDDKVKYLKAQESDEELF